MIFVNILGWITLTMVIIGITFGLFSLFSKRFFFHNQLEDIKFNKPNLWVGLLLVLAVLIVIFAFIAPVIFTDSRDYSRFGEKTAHIGDTIGGIVNPFIALAAVIVTGLAFYMQYQANEQARVQFYKGLEEQKTQFEISVENQRIQFEEQLLIENKRQDLNKFESQFYEMLRLHKENVNEMEVEGYEFRDKVAGRDSIKDIKITKGRKVFVTMIAEIECIYLIIKKCYSEKVKFLIFEDNIYIFPEKDNEKYFFLAYEIFFHGLDAFDEGIDNGNYTDFDSDFMSMLLKELREIRKGHILGKEKKISYYLNKMKPSLEQFYDNKVSNKEFPFLKLYFNYKPFSGHQSRLGHYYRHLIASVGLVVKNKLITYESKREYLKLLRSQFSNHEFVLLYYNYLSTYGSKWENVKNSYLIDYRMLHNIQQELVLPEFNPVVKLLSIKDAFLYKNDDNYSDSLFELYDSISILSHEDNRKLKSNE
ncbi:putative phage abortive infection protein [Sphingobacterium cellulitidis]|uniref:putative phage abortive infection protein n=1 Tax=Sphingobacterium cellulitidis TaxID=1768011 RepID=UPI003C7CFB68